MAVLSRLNRHWARLTLHRSPRGLNSVHHAVGPGLGVVFHVMGARRVAPILGARHAVGSERLLPLPGGLLFEAGLQQRDQGFAVCDPRGVGDKARVSRQLRYAQGFTQAGPHAVVDHRHAECSQAGCKSLVGHDMRARAAHPFGRRAGREVLGIAGQAGQGRGVELAGFDLHAPAGLAADVQRGQQTDTVEHGRVPVQVGRTAQKLRLATRFAVQAGIAAGRLSHPFVAQHALPRPAVAKGRGLQINDPGVDPALDLVAQAQAFHDVAGAEVVQRHVGRGHQLTRDLALGVSLEVQAHAAFGVVVADEGRAHAAHRRTAGSADNIAAGLLDLDHVCAEQTQIGGGQRSDRSHAEIQHPDAFERSSHNALLAAGHCAPNPAHKSSVRALCRCIQPGNRRVCVP